ncbi:MAG: hypothetical protein CMO74_15845 [Verrucomicrobiales bacterium]|nr:hypothetical protein [Verrucomicrobiales bacterium]
MKVIQTLILLMTAYWATADDHWSWQPLKRPAEPDDSRYTNPIDAFITAKLRPHNLSLAPEADRRTLIRRLTFNLTGLPPTPAEVKAFLKDTDPRAYEKLVDRLLASPAYGEHWAQHWLDLARFAETDGFEHDKIRPNAWRYRDWVINALNADLPYNAFVQQQIAGDLLHPKDPQAAIATGFLLAGQDMPDINLLAERRHMILNEMTGTVGSALLGVTVGCARCHDHKFDPVSQREFYQMRAFFESDLQLKEIKSGALTIRAMRTGKSTATHMMVRGDFRRPGDAVQADFPKTLNTAQGQSTEGSRTELARWLTHPKNATAMRLAANRLWQQHFGRPLATPEDFGTQGQPPTHPALLDWLATELPRQKWSLKAMHKLIVSSATWKQSSLNAGNDPSWKQGLQTDPKNRLWSRQDRRRLTGEMLRDTLLFTGGNLNPERGGPGVRPPLPKEITSTLLRNQWPVSAKAEDHRRRSVYLFARRNLRFPFFDLFDRPAGAESCSHRMTSTTAPQSLALLNSDFVRQSAQHFAGRVANETAVPDEQVRHCYQLLFNRHPAAEEFAAARALAGSKGEHLTDLALGLFNSNELLYVD